VLAELPRLAATPLPGAGSDGLATLTLRPHSEGLWTRWRVFDADGKQAAEGQPGGVAPVVRLPEGTYTVEWSAGSGEVTYVRVVLASGRETTLGMGALRLVAAAPVVAVQVFDVETGQAIMERAGGSGTLGGPFQLPPGRYRLYVQSSASSSGVPLDPVDVRPGETTDVRF
jgi:hypothetical protein